MECREGVRHGGSTLRGARQERISNHVSMSE